MELYQIDSYKKECTTNITDVILIKKKTAIACNDLLFHPKGGGQPDDLGTLTCNNEEANVIRLVKQNKKTYYVTDKKFLGHNSIEIGTTVRLTLDWDRRYKFMRCHTGGHILMGSARRIVSNYNALGIEINEKGTGGIITFSCASLSEKQVKEIVLYANDVIHKSIDIKLEESESLDSAKNSYDENFRVDSGLTLRGSVTLIVINGIDVNPCGGTHIKNTAEIGKINCISWDFDDFGEATIFYEVSL